MDILSQLRKSVIIPVVRVDNETQALKTAEILINAGMTSIEITLTVKGAVSVISKLIKQVPESILIGAGTVLTVDEAESVFQAGARFAVSPVFSKDVLAFCSEKGLFFIPGVFTPTEIFQARSAGCRLVKVFPASSAGGPAYIRSMRNLFPDMEFMPTGGVGPGNIVEYLDAGAVLIGSGGELVDRALVNEGRYDEIGKMAEKFLEIVRSHGRPIS